MPSASTQIYRPHWQPLGARFSGGRECLAAFLALELAEVLEGEKPATLIRLADRRQPCGRNLFVLWKRYGKGLTGQAGLAVRMLDGTERSVLLLFYRRDSLGRHLARGSVSALLRRLGYEDPQILSAALDHLGKRFASGEFPHEVGIFLGYPLKDVAGFIGLVRLPMTCQGPWKIFGNPTPSLQLVASYRNCRYQMARRLECCASPLDLLGPSRSDGRAMSEGTECA